MGPTSENFLFLLKSHSNTSDFRIWTSLISRYALEVRQNGKGTGAFFLDKDAAKAVSEEVTQSHMNLSGKKAK